MTANENLDVAARQKHIRAQFLKAVQERREANLRNKGPRQIDAERYHARLREEQEEAERIIAERRHEQVELRRKIWADMIDVRWRDASLEKIRDVDARAVLEDRIQRHTSREGLNQTSVLISGTYGRGKTYVGYAYAYELIARGVLLPSQIFIGTEQALVEIASSGYEKAERLRRLLSPQYRFYLIDDVGRGKFGAPAQRGEVWYELLNHVYSKRLTIVLTTNLIASKGAKNNTVAAWLGEAAVDRLRHLVGTSGNLVMSGENMRQRIGEDLEATYRRKRG